MKSGLNDLENMLASEAPKTKTIQVRVTDEEYESIILLAQALTKKLYAKKITYNKYVYGIIRSHLTSPDVQKKLVSLKKKT